MEKKKEQQLFEAIDLQSLIVDKANSMTPVSAIAGIEGALKCIMSALVSSCIATEEQCEMCLRVVSEDVMNYVREAAQKEAESCKE